MKSRACSPLNVEVLEVIGVGVVVEGVGGDRGKEGDVVVGVESTNFVRHHWEKAADLHEAVEGVVEDEVVGHADLLGFHRVPVVVVVLD
ncbi:hypothetical protein Scep_009716 [Stephania cephalantha]|uniref:Uncharacterized protein n=1 Tax=Stephania cephalantha TaxID=152367 RepID=A0AAP0PGF3_9MAGN